MPIEWAVLFLGTIVACVYFSYNSGLKQGVTDATVLTLAHLEAEGLIHFSNSGKIMSGPENKEIINERNGQQGN